MKIIKSLLCYILILSFTITAVACKRDKNKEENAGVKENFDIKVASNILETYMNYLSKGDMENVKKLYSEKLSKDVKDVDKSEVKIYGFKIDEVNEVGKNALFKVKVASGNAGKTNALLDTYNIKVVKEDNDYKIEEISTLADKEAYVENFSIRLREKDNVKTNLLIDNSGLPRYAYPKDDPAKITKLEVPRENYGFMNFAYSGERIAISTYSQNSFVGVVKIDESLATQGQGGGNGGGDQGGATEAGSSQQGTGSTSRETPVGKEITSLDLIKDSKIELMVFSPGEKFLAVQYGKGDIGKSIRLYDVDSGELVPLNIEEKYPMGKVDVVFSSFDKDTLNFEVLESKNMDKEQSNLLGKWQVSLKDYKIKKF